MDFFFCLPIFFGCPTKIKAEGDQTPRVCPRCNNASVHSAKSRLWFELCFVPLIPMSAKHIWVCTICQWSVPIQPGWEPALPSYGFQRGGQGPPFGGPMTPPTNVYQQGYQPAYVNTTVKPN
ncbi:hypothetical protein A0H81_04440 [Grifola frondosa]|uniref:Zinc-ribbon 15 domain-containing protein n=1 Tax=Grifola frondosa TaxID=5627 RepID=A0A1C7MGI7_GRIFR|nr:hypothetical protein A0H81_04440 [Grifola frondosa]